MEKRFYKLPELPYGYEDLEPYISEKQLRLHHDKHHAAYVNGANSILEKLDFARNDEADLDMKSVLKALSFNVGGHMLHSLFWENLRSPSLENLPSGAIAEEIDNEYGGFERFKKEFTNAATSVEGSGWAALAYCKKTKRPLIMQIEKHNTNVYPMFRILLVLDLWEHAYYLDYQNERSKYVEGFWSLINWDVVNERIDLLL